MIGRQASTLLALLAAVVLLAGCGGSSSSNGTGSSSSTPAKSAATTTPAPGSAGAAAVAACKQAVRAQTTINAEAKAKLEGLCDKAASGNAAEIRKAARTICEEVIDKSAIPAGAAREAALKACKQD
ncbi:MAG TPA: hypothetical protein VHT27_14640 [Solirubrobacteraceae bacterium]|jgi:hypothetical protein|nr:hypothetical protein [Solirubrobacteraceae bacterium]